MDFFWLLLLALVAICFKVLHPQLDEYTLLSKESTAEYNDRHYGRLISRHFLSFLVHGTQNIRI